MKRTITVRAVISSEKGVLLVHNSQNSLGNYILPGGLFSLDCNPEERLEDLIKAQIGLRISSVKVQDVLLLIDPADNDERELCLLYDVLLEAGDLPEGAVFISDMLFQKQLYKVDTFSRMLLSRILQPALTDTKGDRIKMNDVLDSTNIKKVVIYTDGGSRGNPGPSASAFVIVSEEGDVLYEEGKYLGLTTNNQAEYQAVKFALEKALEMGVRVVNFRMDSLLVVNQMLGIYKIKNRDLWPIYVNIKELVERFHSVNFVHVRRELNKEADKLVNDELDAHSGR